MDEETLAVEAAFDGGGHAAKAVQSYIDKLKAEIASLQDAIRRLAEQDATLSVQGGNVKVEMDVPLTDEDREAIKLGIEACDYGGEEHQEAADTLRALLKRLG